MSPHDPGAYRIAIASLGLALAVALAGAVVVLSVGTTTTTKADGHSTAHVTKGSKSKRDGPLKSMTEGASSQGSAAAHHWSSTSDADPSPLGLYLIGGLLAGALIGILIPFPWLWPQEVAPLSLPLKGKSGARLMLETCAVILVIAIAVALAVYLALSQGPPAARIFGGFGVGTLLGLLVPTPALRQPW